LSYRVFISPDQGQGVNFVSRYSYFNYTVLPLPVPKLPSLPQKRRSGLGVLEQKKGKWNRKKSVWDCLSL